MNPEVLTAVRDLADQYGAAAVAHALAAYCLRELDYAEAIARHDDLRAVALRLESSEFTPLAE